MSVELVHYLVVGGLIFGIGIAVALSKSNAIAVLMGVELMLNGVNLTFLSFSRFSSAFAPGDEPLAGHVFVVFVLTVAAAEAAIGLSILVVYFRNRHSIAVEDVNVMKG